MDFSRLPTSIDPATWLRRYAHQLLTGGSLRPLLLGNLRLVPPPPSAQAPADVAAALGPHARALWRRRAALLLARLLAAALLSVVVLNLARLALLPALPLWACWSPAAVLLLLGLWAALCQRPSLGETARLLDRRFGLRESLGTAAELGLVAPGSLGERQRLSALATLDRLPSRPWGGGATGWGRAFLPVLLLVAVGGTLAGTAHRGTGSAAPITAAAHPLGLAQVPAQPAGTGSGGAGAPSLAAQHPRRGSTGSSRPAPFATSFQVRAASAGASLPAGSTSSGAPGQVALDGSNDASGGQAAAASAALSGSARNRGGQRNGAQTGNGAGAAVKSGQGKGSAAAPGGQSPPNHGQGGQQGTGQDSGGAQGGRASTPQQGSQDGQGGAASPNSSQPPGGSKGQGGTQGANPFGQDARPSGPQGRGGGHGGTGKRSGTNGGSPQPATSRGGPTSKSGRAGKAGQPAGRTAPNGPDGMDPTRRGRGASPSDATTRNAPAPGQARAAQGHTLDLGGHAISGQRGVATQLVRVLPQGGVSLPGAAGSTQTGPTTVQGYLPEDSSDISPGEQALLKVYFANGGGS